MFKYIADEIGIDWVSHPLNDSNETFFFEQSRGWNETRWIVLSSTFFSIPAIWHLANYYLYVVYKKEGYISSQEIGEENEVYVQTLIYVSVVILITTIISVNYWRSAKRGWRRNLDMVFAKFSFLTCAYYGFKYITYGPYIFIMTGVLVILPYVYGKSSKLISENNPGWVKYHFAFHLILAIASAVILDGIRLRIND